MSIKSVLVDIVLSGKLMREVEAIEFIREICCKVYGVVPENIINKLVDTYFNYYLCCYKQTRSNKTRKKDILEKYFYYTLKNKRDCIDNLTQISKLVCRHGIIITECVECCNESIDICCHIRQRNRCILCGGTDLCSHFCVHEECIMCSPSKQCRNKKCGMLLSDFANNKCMFCAVRTGDFPLWKGNRCKELTVISRVLYHFIYYPWVFNKIIPHSLYKRRPDAYVIMGSRLLVLEIDEYSHSKSSYIMDTDTRNNDLSEDLFYKDVVVIRFNPDSYVKNGKYHKSCFEKKDDEYIIADEYMLRKRINKLSSVIRRVLNDKKWEKFSVIKLFYGN